MEHQFSKKLKKILAQHFTLMAVPNSCDQKIRSCRIPFIAALVILTLITVNIYIFLAYSTQVWQIVRFQQQDSMQNKMIGKLTAEKSQVIPVLNKSRRFETELTQYRQEYQEMFDTWKRVSRKGNIRFTLASRGFFKPSKSPFVLSSIAKSNTVTTSLDQLDSNLDQLQSILQKEITEQRQLLQNLKAYEHRLDSAPSLWPVYAQICSGFGMRFHPIYRKYIGHAGVDLAAGYGTQVRAAAAGVVSFAGWEEGYGYIVKINHDYGCETCYGHNSRLLVHAGETVKKGQIISLSGNTGESTGPHLHYEVRMNGQPVNPVPFLKE